jgi:hypothetical protein
MYNRDLYFSSVYILYRKKQNMDDHGVIIDGRFVLKLFLNIQQLKTWLEFIRLWWIPVNIVMDLRKQGIS